MAEIKTFIAGPIQTNMYLVYDKNKEGFVIDPGFPGRELPDFIKENKIKVRYILITHGHFDHVCFAKKLREETGARIAMAKKEIKMMEESSQWTDKSMGYQLEKFEPDQIIKDGEVIKIGEMEIKVIATPGHSPEGLSFYLEKEGIVFTGDTLFAGNVGRTDLPGSDPNIIWESINKKLLILPGETRVLPGHGPETNIQAEQK